MAGLFFHKRPAPRHIRGENLFYRHQSRLQEIEKLLDFAALHNPKMIKPSAGVATAHEGFVDFD